MAATFFTESDGAGSIPRTSTRGRGSRKMPATTVIQCCQDHDETFRKFTEDLSPKRMPKQLFGLAELNSHNSINQELWNAKANPRANLLKCHITNQVLFGGQKFDTMDAQ